MAEPTNEQRAEYAYRAVLAYDGYRGSETTAVEESITDLLTDLLHLTAQYGDPEMMHARIWRHYIAEASGRERGDA